MEKRELTSTVLLARLLSGFVGGLAGMLALLIVFFVLNGFLPAVEGSSSLSVFTVMVMAFIGTLVSNVMTGLMVSFVDSQKYSRRKTILVHLFTFNLIFFILAIPFYLVGSSLEIITAITAMHFILSAFISALLMEVIAGYEYAITGIYSAALGVLISIGIAFVILTFDIQLTLFIFLAMPIVWVILEMASGFTELMYEGFLHFYGIDALSAQTDLGGDNEKEEEEEDVMEEGSDREDGDY